MICLRSLKNIIDLNNSSAIASFEAISGLWVLEKFTKCRSDSDYKAEIYYCEEAVYTSKDGKIKCSDLFNSHSPSITPPLSLCQRMFAYLFYLFLQAVIHKES